MIYQLGLLLFILVYTPFISAQESQFPAMHDYIAFDREAEVLNLTEVKKAIGSPIAVLKSDKPLNIHCRVLIDEYGRYVRHTVNRVDHPELIGPVALQIPNLQFLPAEKNREHVSCWVNVPFTFQPSDAARMRREPYHRPRLIPNLYSPPLPTSSWNQLRRYDQAHQWVESAGLATQMLKRGQKWFRRMAGEEKLSLYLLRSRALLAQGMTDEAHRDLNEALALARREGSLQAETQIRSLRILSWLVIGDPSNIVEDYRFLSDEWQKAIAWKEWQEALQAKPLRDSLLHGDWIDMSDGLPTDLKGIIYGLGIMEHDQVKNALPWLEIAYTSAGDGVWKRSSSIRIAECLMKQAQARRQVEAWMTNLPNK